MMHREALEEIVDGVELGPDGSPIWFGASLLAEGASVTEGQRNLVASSLARHLYTHAYCYGRVVRGMLELVPPRRRDVSHLMRAFRANNCGRGRRSQAQVVERGSDDQVVVDWCGIRLTACDADVRVVSEDGRALLNVGRERLFAQPDAYVALSDREPEIDDLEVRLYWHVQVERMPDLLEALTYELNRVQAPFSVKFMTTPPGRSRCDGAVLYLPVSSFIASRRILRAVHARLGTALSDSVPLWTLELGRGLGVAVSPPDGRSFGELRSQQLATAVLETLHQHPTESNAVDRVMDRVAADGFDIDRPYGLDSSREIEDELWI